MLISRKPCQIVILTKFLTHRVFLQSSHPNFQKKFVSPKMAAILNFRIFRKNCKTQKCLYLENRARQSNFDENLTRRVPLQSSNSNFKKMAAILNFRIFRKIAKHRNAYISQNCARQSNFNKSFDQQGISAEQPSQFSKHCRLAQNGGHFEFSNFSQKMQNTKMLISGKPCQIEQTTQTLVATTV